MKSAREFLDVVAEPNVNEFVNSHWHERSAINAILTLDCLLGILFVELRSSGQINDACDTTFREGLAKTDEKIRIVRDAAFALKHGELLRSTPRVVRRADQVAGKVPTLTDGFFLDRDFVEAPVMMIEKEDGSRIRADLVLGPALVAIKAIMAKYGL